MTLRDERIRAIAEKHSRICRETVVDSFGDVRKSIEAAIREALEAEWIPVTERLPDSCEPVIACNGEESFGGFCDGSGVWRDGTEALDVAHWRPYPPPKKEKS